MINKKVEYDFNAYVQQQLEDRAFKKEYDALETEFTLKQALIDARKKSKW